MNLFVRFLLLAAVWLPCAAAQKNHVFVISLDGFPAFALEDPKLPIPTIRKLAAAGAQARRVTTVNPSVTWPNHTAIATGVDGSQNGVLVNGTITRTGAWPPVKIEPWIDRDKMVHAPTIYDAAYKAGMITAQVDWVAIKNAPTITVEFPEVPSVTGKIEKEMIAAGLIDAASVETFGKTNILRRDQLWTDAGVYLIKRHKPNLLLFHLLSLDSTHHTFGPRTLASLGTMAFLDSCVNRLVEATRAAGILDRTTFILVSDHGFKQVTKQIRAGVMAGDKAHVVPEGGSALVYARDPAELPALRKIFEGAEGISDVVTKERYAEFGFPDPAKDQQMADMVLFAKTGYAYGGGTSGPAITINTSPTGSHGYNSADPDMDSIFIASGRSIKPGVTIDRIANTDVAPTIATLLGIKMPAPIKGKTIDAILTGQTR